MFIDYYGNKIENLTINGNHIFNNNYYNKGRIYIEKKYLKIGNNFLKMNILNKYRNDGYGMHSFFD